MNSIKENIVQSLLSSPMCSYLWNREHFSSVIGCSPIEAALLNYIHYIFAFLGVTPTANPTSSNLEILNITHSRILNSTHSNTVIDQPGAYTFHPVEDRQSSPASAGCL